MGGPATWSTDPTANQTIDGDVYYVEGQPPPTLNNAGRGVMVGASKFSQDIACAGTAVRTSGDVYTLTTNQGLTAAAVLKAHTVSFLVNTANLGPAQLKPDGQLSKPLRRAANRALAPGDLSTSALYTACYVPSLDVYMIVSPAIDRPGKIDVQATSTIDPGYLPCDGAAVSRTTYAALFGVISTTYGAGNGSTTFNVPDLDGRAIFGADNAKGRLTGAGGLAGALGSAGGTQAHALTTAQLAAHAHGTVATTSQGAHDHGGNTGSAGSHDHGGSTGNAGAHSHSGSTSLELNHDHGGSTGAVSNHTHGITSPQGRNGTAGSGSNITGLWFGSSADQTGGDGSHSHNYSNMTGAGSHTHTFSTGTEPNHQHTISNQGNHTHTITSDGAHTHNVTVNSAGSGDAHPNVPPGLVCYYVIKA